MHPHRFRFDAFELDVRDGCLRRHGRPVTLSPQPFKLLVLLIERAGEPVSREAIRDHLWGEAFVEADDGINFCIHQIRSALEDSARRPLYVETLPRRGYRFVAKVGPVVASGAVTERTVRMLRRVGWRRLGWSAAALAAAAGAIAVVVFAPDAQLPDRSRLAPEARHRLLYAEVLLDQRSPDEISRAVGLLDELVLTNPQTAELHARLAQGHSLLEWDHGRPGHRGRAQYHASMANRLAPGLAESRLASGILYFHARDYPAAVEALRFALAHRPDDLHTGLYLGKTLRRMGQWDEAWAVLRRTFESRPRSVDLTYGLASTAVYLHRYEAAGTYLDHMIALAPTNWVPRVVKAVLPLWAAGDVETARTLVDQGAGAVGLGTMLLNSRTLARIFAGTVAADPASFAFEQVHVNEGRFHVNLGEAYWYLGDPERARAHYDAARPLLQARIDENRWAEGFVGEPVVLLAAAYAGLADTTAALDLVSDAAALLPLSKDDLAGIRLRQHIAEVLVRVGQHARALDHLEFLIDRPSLLSPGLLEADPVWAPLRGSARYRNLVARR